MEFSIAWNAVCLVCLQEGEMRSIYEKDEKDVAICEKIMQCSNIVIQQGMNLPEQICSLCTDDLQVAYRFRNKCEASNVILKSFIDSNTALDIEIPSSNGQIYKYKPPTGLNVKKIKTSPILISGEDSPRELTIVYTEEVDESDDEGGTCMQADFQEVDDQTVSDSQSQDKQLSQNDNIEIIEHDAETFLKSEPEDVEESKIDVIDKTVHKKSVEAKKPSLTNRSRRKNNIFKENFDKIITLGNTSQLVDNLTTVTYISKTRQDGKPMKICEICGNSYKYQHALDSHMRRHRNEKPFACEFCDRAFVANVELRRHMRVHTGQKPYACNFCDRRFSDFGSRIKHERTHTGERPYKCPSCDKSFAYAHVLSVHILTHTGEKKFKCELCSRGFTKKVYLKSHMARHEETFSDSNKTVESNRPHAVRKQETLVKKEPDTESEQQIEIINEGMLMEKLEADDSTVEVSSIYKPEEISVP